MYSDYMRSRRPHLLWFTAVVIFTVWLGWREYILQPDNYVHLSFLDVGQGDSELITSPSGKHILIDGGPDLTTLEHLGSHLSFFNRQIDLLVLTHPHLDHVASLPEVLKRYNVRHVLLAGTDETLPRYQQFLTEIRDEKIPVLASAPGQNIDMGDGLRLTMLWPPPELFGTHVSHTHDAMVALKAIYKNHTALFTGDLEAKFEKEVMDRGEDVHADILKVGHHGSLTSTSTGFLLAVNPRLAIISVGTGNSFGHPKQAILSRLAYFGIPVKRTDKDGTVEVTWK